MSHSDIEWGLAQPYILQDVAMQHSCKDYLSDLESDLGRKRMRKRKHLHWLQS